MGVVPKTQKLLDVKDIDSFDCNRISLTSNVDVSESISHTLMCMILISRIRQFHPSKVNVSQQRSGLGRRGRGTTSKLKVAFFMNPFPSQYKWAWISTADNSIRLHIDRLSCGVRVLLGAGLIQTTLIQRWASCLMFAATIVILTDTSSVMDSCRSAMRCPNTTSYRPHS